MPFDRSRYPEDWRSISIAVRTRSGGWCECEGECGVDHAAENAVPFDTRALPRCARRNGAPLGGYRVVLTVAHLWRGPCAEHHAAGVKCGDPTHLKAMCQRCHLTYDAELHAAHARASRRAKKATGDLFG